MNDRGSALVLAIVVLVVLTFLGIALLGLCQYEGRMAQADARSKSVFYVAEAGLEHARATLVDMDAASAKPGSVDDELGNAAGANDSFDFDPETVRPVYDSNGQLTGFTGYGDDAPVQSFTSFSGGGYIAFLSNDGIDEALDPLDDTNNLVVLTAVGAGRGSAVEVVQALVRRIPPATLPAAITLLGPTPSFSGGTSKSKYLTGDDCDGNGEPGLYVPVVGVLGPAAETAAEAGVDEPGTYVSGPDTGVDTVTDIDGTIDPLWKDCTYLLFLAAEAKAAADVVGDSSTPVSELGTPGDPKTVYIDGDYSLTGAVDGAGTLWVTGTLTIQGAAGWEGAIYAVGAGDVQRNGGGNGVISGGYVVANVAGQDATMETDDDCLGADGLAGTADDGFEGAAFETAGGGAQDLIYCTLHTGDTQGQPFRIVQFRQR